jgi:hypothetical protein
MCDRKKKKLYFLIVLPWCFKGGDFHEKKLPFNQVGYKLALFAGGTQFFACTQTRWAGRGSPAIVGVKTKQIALQRTH